MKHEWKTKEKKCTDVEQGLQENKKMKREYVIEVVYETKFKRWRAVTIYMLVMFILGLSCYMLYSYISRSMSITSERYSLMSESQFESQKSSPSIETPGEVLTKPLAIDKQNDLQNESIREPHMRELANSNTQSEVKSDNTVQEIDSNSQLTSLSKFIERLTKDYDYNLERSSMDLSSNIPKLTERFLADFSDKLLLPLNADIMPNANAHSSTNMKSDNTMPADDVKDFRISFLDNLKLAETYSEKSSVESGVVKCPPGESDEVSSEPPHKSSDEYSYESIFDYPDKSEHEITSNDRANLNVTELEQKNTHDNMDFPPLSKFEWVNGVPTEDNSPYLNPSKKKRLESVRNEVETLKPLSFSVGRIVLHYSNDCVIVIATGVVDTFLCPLFTTFFMESNLESSTQTATEIASLPPISSSVPVLPSETTTTTTTHVTTIEDYNDNDYNNDDNNNDNNNDYNNDYNNDDYFFDYNLEEM